jgi:hypothetical protein
VLHYWIKIVGRLQSPRGNRIDTLQKRIRYLEERYRKDEFSAFLTAAAAQQQIKKAKEELQALDAADAEYDKKRHLILYSSKCTGYKFFCSPCWDQAYSIYEEERKRQKA